MRNKWCIHLPLIFIISVILFTASCAQKAVLDVSALRQQAEDQEAIKAKEAAEKARLEELAVLREEARIKEALAKQEVLENNKKHKTAAKIVEPTVTPPVIMSDSTYVQERRIALVIGNGKYKYSPLPNPVNDANDMAAALKKLGFSGKTKNKR